MNLQGQAIKACGHMTRGLQSADAEDMIQDIIVSVLETMDRYDESRGDLGGYLYTRSRTFGLSWLRQEDRRRARAARTRMKRYPVDGEQIVMDRDSLSRIMNVDLRWCEWRAVAATCGEAKRGPAHYMNLHKARAKIRKRTGL